MIAYNTTKKLLTKGKKILRVHETSLLLNLKIWINLAFTCVNFQMPAWKLTKTTNSKFIKSLTRPSFLDTPTPNITNPNPLTPTYSLVAADVFKYVWLFVDTRHWRLNIMWSFFQKPHCSEMFHLNNDSKNNERWHFSHLNPLKIFQAKILLFWQLYSEQKMYVMFSVSIYYNPANIYLFKINNRNRKKVWNMFKNNNKNTTTTSLTSFWCF